MIAEARREQIRELLMATGEVTIGQLQARFGVSPMTARRDLVVLEAQGSARRTHGGAVLPSSHAPEHSFAQRVEVAAAAKLRLADAALELLRPGETVLLDSSSTAYFLARRIAETGLAVRVLTNSAPVIQALVGSLEQVELYLLGGRHRPLSGSFVGPSTVRMIREHFVDWLFFSVTGVTAGGVLTESDDLEAAVKRAMLEQTYQSVLLVDAFKLGTHGRQAIVPLRDVSLVLAEGDDPRLHADGVNVRLV
ncbi:DeoR/GlpR transcriptional regulator [Solirubrobacter sp. CPCC 204708]|uniref:DeoR/GlpR family DNA-binding transcription regulator n=1 Tax=Solirubrobacter deserti TaxID=2282478 RepID=A0ABT4RJV6_9ACTN|nr:DeoR/GlpR family DNA-binding transcription regulator [Solirubrobacter deserti]MBE2317671.1 DeoR/GlpR transcriptional regulator [Solirubrobacter deserti]MDA0138621.1 DeoR/GlpR family DNA-binding transcription regulator [Solirubrobacter deserti]